MGRQCEALSSGSRAPPVYWLLRLYESSLSGGIGPCFDDSQMSLAVFGVRSSYPCQELLFAGDPLVQFESENRVTCSHSHNLFVVAQIRDRVSPDHAPRVLPPEFFSGLRV